VSVVLDLPGRAQVRDRAVDENLGPALPAQERPATDGDQQVTGGDLGSAEAAAAARAGDVGDGEPVPGERCSCGHVCLHYGPMAEKPRTDFQAPTAVSGHDRCQQRG
jgi:hypothetical protein